MEVTLGLGPGALAGVLASFALGGFLKGALGFGLPLITMSAITLVAPVELGLALNAVVLPLMNIPQAAEGPSPRAVALRFWPALAAMAPGVGIGMLFLTAVDETALRLILGAVILTFVTLSAVGAHLTIRPASEGRAGVATGFAAGVVSALTTAHGPVLLIYLLGLGLDRVTFRAAIGQLFLVSGAVVAASYAAVGIVDGPRAALALVCMGPALLGAWAGRRLGGRLDQRLFRNAVMAVLTLIGLNFVTRALGLV